MPSFVLEEETDIPAGESNGSTLATKTLKDLLRVNVTMPATIIEEILPIPGAVVLFGAQKSGKTVLSVQMAMCIAANVPLFDNYRINQPGGALIIEKDDPAGEASLKGFVTHTKIPIHDAPFHYIAGEEAQVLVYGDDFLHGLEERIRTLELKVVVLDSHTALRGSRSGPGDVVKADLTDFGQFDLLAKKCSIVIIIIHHISNGRYHNDWSDRAAGSYAVSAATEAQICVERFRDLDINAPERLVRNRGRHIAGKEMLLRFDEETLGYDLILEGGAAHLWPEISMLKTAFGARQFEPKDITMECGLARSTAHRLINNLLKAGAVRKHGYGAYSIEVSLNA